MTQQGRTAVITGAASGIGYALAQRLALEGCNLVLADVNADALRQAAADIGVDVVTHVTDVGNRDDVEALRSAAVKAFGKVHLLFNNAGVQVAGPMWKMSSAKWKWLVDVNLMGVVHGVQAFVPHMIDHGEAAHVVNTASMAGVLTPPGMSTYCATKHAVVALTECLAHDLKQEAPHIKATVLCPAFLQTNLHSTQTPPEGDDETLMSDDEAQAWADKVEQLVTEGLDVNVLVDKVIDALAKPQLYVFTHPEMAPFAAKRFKGIERALTS